MYIQESRWPRPQPHGAVMVELFIQGGSIDIGPLLKMGAHKRGHQLASQFALELVEKLQIPDECMAAQTWVCPIIKVFRCCSGVVALDLLLKQLEFYIATSLELPSSSSIVAQL